MRSFIILFVFSATVLVSCQNEPAANHDENEQHEDSHATTENPNSKYKLSPFSSSPEFPDAKINLTSYINGKFDFEVSGDSYQLGAQTSDAGQKMCANSGKGQHIHAIIDNGPYNARYTASFDDVPMEDGNHYVLAFLSRSYHESIKTKEGHTAQYVTVTDNTAGNFESISDPMLFYSRPKGTYVGEKNTKKVMLDFYVINLKLGDDYKVLADINGEVHTINTWQPYYIEGLPLGKNKIKLTLVDGGGNVVDAPLNPVEREFELKVDELEN
jgi:hypothetical protein